MPDSTVFVLVTDKKYFNKAIVTIQDLKYVGKWNGDIVLITIDFYLDISFKTEFNIIEMKFPEIDKTNLLEKIGPQGFSNSDKREIHKLNQWEKLHVFDDVFMKWDRVVFLDAGLRVLDNVSYLLELNYKNKILAPNDAAPNFEPNKIFKYQISYDNMNLVELVKADFGESIFDSQHMLNCMWVYDTNILHTCNKKQLIDAMNTYTLCRNNEMTLMNLLFHFKYHLWVPFPEKTSNNKYLFEWCESNHSFHTTWKDYCFIKYSISLTLNETPYEVSCIVPEGL
uniref:Nucleotide-diphospho-sugar transferase domain-containing protein n=1 Tax=viral metagenome TaxID=1070528 RepID=A0A6C0B1D1_9ZZZZ